ncbi:LexA-binding, inner membrane-associated putative hydrolase [Natronorubrum sediminis]|uniref:LexA-binding, inner membrane-associated putative hydrolase n=1 Tax=Natronorubrum sediminis TaxID=640943 RepID=A0A1H6FLE2_9EURY|nr:metal-dependent hydrolase [Natronorubrum sediminis]SEH10663.1 LexA-binding, inner membrane-associated putative hydrolase [Natronorubrum sediminis]
MWPWEHAIVGYLAYSLFCHTVYRDSPGGLEAFAVVFASVLPDLIDKPLAWEYGIFDSGYALGHSIFFAVPLSLFVGIVAHSLGRPRTGLAFGLGYLLHLPSDVVDAYVREGVYQPELMYWPVETTGSHGHSRNFLEQFFLLFSQYQSELLAGDLSTYMWIQIGMASGAALLWLYDGAPVLREVLVGSFRFIRSLVSPENPTETSPERK